MRYCRRQRDRHIQGLDKQRNSGRWRASNAARRVGGDHAATQAHLAVVDHRALAWRHSPLGLGEAQREVWSVVGFKGAGRIGLPVARFGGQRASGWGVSRHPARVLRAQRKREQPRVVVALHHPERVLLHVLARDEPRQVDSARIAARCKTQRGVRAVCASLHNALWI